MALLSKWKWSQNTTHIKGELRFDCALDSLCGGHAIYLPVRIQLKGKTLQEVYTGFEDYSHKCMDVYVGFWKLYWSTEWNSIRSFNVMLRIRNNLLDPLFRSCCFFVCVLVLVVYSMMAATVQLFASYTESQFNFKRTMSDYKTKLNNRKTIAISFDASMTY